MKKITLFLLLLLALLPGTAQDIGLRGKLISANTPVEYANIVLQRPDSSFVTGLITDQRGNFTMNNLQTGDYLLSISCMGYESNSLQIDNLNSYRDLGTIHIEAATINLEEVTVTAANIINTIDKKIVLPTAHQVKASTDGLNLLQQMKLNRLYVNPFQKTVTTTGEGNVQLRINGVKAEIHEVLAIRPQDVVRIEYHDDPSLRYGEGTAAVVDYIIRRKETGGFVSLNLQNSPHTGWGNDNFNIKVNHKKSEFALSYYNGYRNLTWWRLNEENFTFADGSTFTRLENGIPQKGQNFWQNLRLNYSYHETDKWFFNVAVRGHHNYSKQRLYSNLYPEDEPENAVDMRDYETDKSLTPSVDLYFQRTFRNKQYLILNAVGTYISSEN